MKNWLEKERNKHPVTPRQMAGIDYSHRNAEKLSGSPFVEEIIEKRRKGARLDDLAQQYASLTDWELSHSVGRNAIDILLSEQLGEEHRRISATIRDELASAKGNTLVREKRGIFGRNSNQHKVDSAVGGKNTRDNRIGIFGMTHEEYVDSGKKAGRASAKASGKHVWETAEIDDFLRLSTDPKFQHQGYLNHGKPDYGRIAIELENRFGTTFDRNSLKQYKCYLANRDSKKT